MIQKKICMLGAFAVGKTSLVKRFVHSIFSEKYLTTVGVKIDRKIVEVAGRQVSLVLWDIEGDDDFRAVQMSYVRGASGYLLVVDGVRPETLESAKQLKLRVESSIGAVPFIILLNKSDLKHDWLVSRKTCEESGLKPACVLETSAKSGENVENAFKTIAKIILS